MAAHSSILAWRTPWTEEPGGPQSWGCRVRHYWATLMHMLLLSRVQLFATPWTAAHQASLSITNSRSLSKFMSIESVMPSNHFIHSFPFLTTFNLSQHQGLFQWQFFTPRGQSIGVSASNEYSGWISFRIDWLDLLAGQGTLKSLLQYHSSKASILHCSAFFKGKSLIKLA